MSFPQNMPKPPPKLPQRPGAPSATPSSAAQPAAPQSGGLGGLFKKLTAPAAQPQPQPQAAAPSLPGRPAVPPMPGRPAAPALPGRPGAPTAVAAPSLPARPGMSGAASAATAPAQAARPSMPAGASARPLNGAPAPSPSGAGRIDLRTLPPTMAPMVEAIIMYDELLVEENEHLRACNPKGVEALQPRKQEATKLYNDRLRTLLSDPTGMRGQPPEIRDQVMNLIKQLEARCSENASLLKANMEATEKVFGVINNAVIEARRREAMYTRSGGVNWGNNTSVAFNATA
ncbi:MAG TPA: hypothetical protein VM661_13255 [Candidatus Sulfotelmatobacter sp.]|jgi:hypothetical protein|nr:hypothetical protein [Candidatus Sulfotelmatobacter sp.]